MHADRLSYSTTSSTFEYLCGYASTGNSHFLLLGVYRPGSQGLSATFFDDLSAVFERLAVYNCPVVICGDFNVHVDDDNCPYAARLRQLLQSFGCVQHVGESTHSAGHTLDLVITRKDTAVHNLRVGCMISDHALVTFSLKAKRPVNEARWTTSRAWRRLDRDVFASELSDSVLCGNLDIYENTSVDDLATLYRNVMTELLDRHCPVVRVKRRLKHATPWFDAECRDARRRTRRAERRYRQRLSDADKCVWAEKAATMQSVYEAKSSQFWRDEIASNKDDMRQLWRTLHSVLGEAPDDINGGHTADDFAEFFQRKVDDVRASCSSTSLYDVPWRLSYGFNRRVDPSNGGRS